jgi:hypothetical protein
MKVHLLKPDLHQIDAINTDTFALCLFEEDRPPRGLCGLVDWRLCGRISKMILDGQALGRLRESVLTPAYGRLPCNRLVIFGLGSRQDFSLNRAREVSWFLCDTLRKLKAPSFAIALPGSPVTALSPRARMEVFLEEAIRVFGAEDASVVQEVFVCEPTEVHRELSEAIGMVTRKLKAIWR